MEYNEGNRVVHKESIPTHHGHCRKFSPKRDASS